MLKGLRTWLSTPGKSCMHQTKKWKVDPFMFGLKGDIAYNFS